MIYILPLKSHIFSNLFTQFKSFTDNLFILLLHQSIFIQSLDLSHVSMMEVSIDKNWFDKYSFQNESFGISTELLAKVFQTYKSGQSIQIELFPDYLSVSFFTETKKDKQFKLKLLDIDCENMQVPDQEYSIEFDMGTKMIKSIFDELAIFSDSVSITCSKENGIDLISKSDICESCISIDKDKCLSYNVSDNIDICLNLRYLQLFSQFHKLSESVKISMLEEAPIKYEYSIGENSYIRFYLAPKMDDDYET